jgi:hypothetical protein
LPARLLPERLSPARLLRERLSPAQLVLPTRVGLAIAIVVVAGAGRLALPAASGTEDAAAVTVPAIVAAPTAPATASAARQPSFAPAPSSAPAAAPRATATHSAHSSTAASRGSVRRPVAEPTPTVTRKSTVRSTSTTSSRSAVSSPYSSASSSSGDPHAIAQAMLAAHGWGGQMSCLDPLWNRESGWSTTAGNPSGAYGIPQALPGSKMASAGSDWRTNPRTQIAWGLGYIASTYGSPCAAWSHSQSTGWY